MTREHLIEVIDSVAAVVLVIDTDYRVLLTNYYAIKSLPRIEDRMPLGHLLKCARFNKHSGQNGFACGFCPDCRVRQTVEKAVASPDKFFHTEACLSIATSRGDEDYNVSLSTKGIDIDGEPCVVLTLFDLTTFKHFAEELALARSKAEESDRMKTKFLQCMSHEIRTPLNAIVGFSELLTQTDEIEEKQQYIDIINTNNELLLKIISDVLDMAKIESGNMQVSLKPTEISSLVKLAETSAKLKLQPGVSLNSVLGADECVAVTDPALLGQVLMNLLINACKFTPKGAITFGYEVYDDELYFFVKDTGIGITPDFKDKLFDLFEKNDSFSQGLGLGLPISNAIVKRLGGNMGVESRGQGRGSTFWFTIPYSPAMEQSAEDAPAAPGQEPPQAAKKNDRITILVAEDNDSNYLLFQSILKKKYDVERAADGLEAIAMYKKINPDLILMDINMPNMDGYEAVREIRKLSPTVPVIAVTAYAFVTDRQRILENGFNGYVSKPINIGRLEQEINQCLGVAPQQ